MFYHIAAHIGISLPGSGESPSCPVYVDGRKYKTLTGSPDQLAREFRQIIDDYVDTHYTRQDELAASV